MRPARLTFYSVLALAGVGAVIAGCGSWQTDSIGTHAQPSIVVMSKSAPAPDNRELVRSAQRAVVGAFAASYGRYLDGRLPATALADATRAVQRQAGAPIAPDARAGNLTVAYIHAPLHGDS